MCSYHIQTFSCNHSPGNSPYYWEALSSVYSVILIQGIYDKRMKKGLKTHLKIQILI